MLSLLLRPSLLLSLFLCFFVLRIIHSYSLISARGSSFFLSFSHVVSSFGFSFVTRSFTISLARRVQIHVLLLFIIRHCFLCYIHASLHHRLFISKIISPIISTNDLFPCFYRLFCVASFCAKICFRLTLFCVLHVSNTVQR